jgi:hypothetical protein
MAYRFLRGDRDQPFLIPSLLRALRRDLLGVELASSGVSRPVGPCRPKAAAAGGLRRAPRGGAEEVVTSRSGQRIDRPLLPASCPMCGHVVLRADGVSREGATCWCPGSGVRQPVPLPPPGRNRCGPSAAASTVTSAGRCAGGHRPVRRPRCGQRVSDTPAASPSGVRIRAAQRPSAMAALGRTRRRGVQQPGEWTGGRTPRPGRFRPGRRAVRSVFRPAWPPRRWGRTAAEPAADTSDRSAAAVRGLLSKIPDTADSAPQPAMACLRARPLQEPVAGAAAAGRM